MKIRGVVDWRTKIPLDTPLARLVSTDAAIEVIKRNICFRVSGMGSISRSRLMPQSSRSLHLI
jgi:hypothetical protein